MNSPFHFSARLTTFLALSLLLSACGGGSSSGSAPTSELPDDTKQLDATAETGQLDGSWQSLCHESFSVDDVRFYSRYLDSYQGSNNIGVQSYYDASDCSGEASASVRMEYKMEYGEKFILSTGAEATRYRLFLNRVAYEITSERISIADIDHAVPGSIFDGFFQLSDDGNTIYYGFYNGGDGSWTPNELEYDYPVTKIP